MIPEKSKRHVSLNFLIYIVLIIISILTLFPVVYSILGSFKDNMELMTSSHMIPDKWTASNYSTAWEMVDFSRYTINSIIISASVVAGAIITSTMSAYVLSRKAFPGKRFLRMLYISSMFISLGAATLYPIFKMVVDLKMNNSYLGVILVLIGAQVVNIMLVEGYLSGISKELDEAAIIDGCGFFRVYWNIILPLIKPIIAVVGIFSFRGAWNAYLVPMVLTMGNKNVTPLAVAVIQMKSSGEMAASWSILLAGSSISIIPIIIVYGMFNKYFVSGLTSGAVKG